MPLVPVLHLTEFYVHTDTDDVSIVTIKWKPYDEDVADTKGDAKLRHFTGNGNSPVFNAKIATVVKEWLETENGNNTYGTIIFHYMLYCHLQDGVLNFCNDYAAIAQELAECAMALTGQYMAKQEGLKKEKAKICESLEVLPIRFTWRTAARGGYALNFGVKPVESYGIKHPLDRLGQAMVPHPVVTAEELEEAEENATVNVEIAAALQKHLDAEDTGEHERNYMDLLNFCLFTMEEGHMMFDDEKLNETLERMVAARIGRRHSESIQLTLSKEASDTMFAFTTSPEENAKALLSRRVQAG